MTWQQVKEQGGKPGNKTGLAYTLYEDDNMKVPRPTNISADLRIAGFRAGGSARIFGVAIEQIFYLLWFDPNHEVVDG